ncbi:MAG: hypothetical protein ACI915_004872 [Gammaproteobacteria bacterium]|jgi:hypothetical protein
MTWKTVLISVVLFNFIALTGYAIMEVGYIGVIASHFDHWGGIQVLADLVIARGLAVIWMLADARKRRVTAWPYVVLTLFLGAIGPLVYLLKREWRSHGAINPGLQRS